MRRLAVLGVLCAVSLASLGIASEARAEAWTEWVTAQHGQACEEAEPSDREQCWRGEAAAVANECRPIEAESGPYAAEGCWEEVEVFESSARAAAQARETVEREAAAEEQRERERGEREREARHRQHEKWREQARHQREWRHKPTVTLRMARYFARKLMLESEFSIWEVNCRGGRINRTHWRCNVRIFYHCLRGRIRVTGIGHKDHRAWYRAQGSELHPCS